MKLLNIDMIFFSDLYVKNKKKTKIIIIANQQNVVFVERNFCTYNSKDCYIGALI